MTSHPFEKLRRAGLIIESGGLIGLTDAGQAQAGVTAGTPASTAELLESGARSEGRRRVVLERLLQAYPRPLTREELAATAGYEVTRGTYSTYLSTLRRNGLVQVGEDKLRAADVLFLAGQPGSRR